MTYSNQNKRDYLDYGVQGGSALIGGGAGLALPQMLRNRISRGRKVAADIPLPEKTAEDYKTLLAEAKKNRKIARAEARKTQPSILKRAGQDVTYYDPRKLINSKKNNTLWADLAGTTLKQAGETTGLVNKAKVIGGGVGRRLAPAGRLALAPLAAVAGWQLSGKAMDALRRNGYSNR